MNQKKNIRLEKPVCNYCSGSKTKSLFPSVFDEEHICEFAVVQCTECQLVYLSPRPVTEDISFFYSHDTYWGDLQKKRSIAEIEKERNRSFQSIYKKLLSYYKKGKILDVGAGTGLFLTKFKELGWDVNGTEVSEEAIKYASMMYKIHLQKKNITDIKQKNAYEIISLHHVLEHMHDPSSVIEHVSKMLKKNGILLIALPNFDSFGRFLFKEYWYPLQPPTHLYHFTPNTLLRFLKKYDLQVIKVDHNNWHYNYYSIFESVRREFTKNNAQIASISETVASKQNSAKQKKYSIKKEISKVLAHVFTYFMVLLESLTQRGEIIIVYAKKEH